MSFLRRAARSKLPLCLYLSMTLSAMSSISCNACNQQLQSSTHHKTKHETSTQTKTGELYSGMADV